MLNTEQNGPGILVRLGNFFFLHRNWLLTLFMIGLMVAFHPTYPRNSAYLGAWLDIAGIAVILAGQGIRAVTIGLEYIVRGGKHGKVYANNLVTGGVFNHCRNPLYIGNIMVYMGLFIVFNNPMVYLIGVPFILLVYISIVAAEENYLYGKFGEEYADYCKRVNRWLPRLGGLSKIMDGMTFSWRRVVVKEYGSTYIWIIGMLGLLAYKSLVYSTVQREHTRLIALTAMLVAVTVLWIVVRYLKLSRKLRAD